MSKEEVLDEAQSEVVRTIIRDLKRKHIKQDVVADLIGVSQQTISKYLRERDPPLVGLRIAIAMHTRGLVDLCDLLGGRRQSTELRPQNFEDYARSNGLDPDDPEVQELLGAAFRDAKTREKILESVAYGLRMRSFEHNSVLRLHDSGAITETRSRK